MKCRRKKNQVGPSHEASSKKMCGPPMKYHQKNWGPPEKYYRKIGWPILCSLIAKGGLFAPRREPLPLPTNPQSPHHKRILIDRSLNALTQRHPSPMPRPRLHPNQDRIRPRLHSLQRSRVLEAMRRIHAVIMVPRSNQRRRIRNPRPDVMQRRVLINRSKLFSVLRRRPVLLLPTPTQS